MTKFIQLPQAGTALPLLLNVNDIHKVDFFNGPERGGREILLRVWLNTPKAIDLHTIKFTNAGQGIATYWRLHAMLSPAPLELPQN